MHAPPGHLHPSLLIFRLRARLGPLVSRIGKCPELLGNESRVMSPWVPVSHAAPQALSRPDHAYGGLRQPSLLCVLGFALVHRFFAGHDQAVPQIGDLADLISVNLSRCAWTRSPVAPKVHSFLLCTVTCSFTLSHPCDSGSRHLFTDLACAVQPDRESAQSARLRAVRLMRLFRSRHAGSTLGSRVLRSYKNEK